MCTMAISNDFQAMSQSEMFDICGGWSAAATVDVAVAVGCFALGFAGPVGAVAAGIISIGYAVGRGL